MDFKIRCGSNKFFRSKLLRLKTIEDEANLLREYKSQEENILKEVYQIIVYSDVQISRDDLFVMSNKEKEILINLVKEKRDIESKNVK